MSALRRSPTPAPPPGRRLLAVIVGVALLVCGCVSGAPSIITTATSPGLLSSSAPSASNPSGQAMPVGDLPGWTQVFTDDFTSGDVPVGSFPGPAYEAKWSVNYTDGTPDTAGSRGAPSRYYPSKVLSVTGGMLDMYLHTEDGISMGAAPSPKFAGGNLWPYNSQVYGRYSVRFRADSVKGFKTAWLLWPDSGNWPFDGEIDFPEADLSGTITAANHHTGGTENSFTVFDSGATYAQWHTATVEWSPNRVQFFMDGRSIGVTTTGVPADPLHYILQTESCFTVCPKASAAGHVQIDWLAIWKRS